MKENNNYNATDFARYHGGLMPAAEMHALEKAALEDPFLADALEGYAHSKDPKKETDEIRRQLDEKQKQEKRFSLLSFSQNTWWKVAAMLVLICGAGYLFFFTNIKKENRLAEKKEVIKKEQDELVSRINTDTNSQQTNIALEKASAGKANIDTRKIPAPVSEVSSTPGNKSKPEVEIKLNKEDLEDRSISEKEHQLATKNKEAVSRKVTVENSLNPLLLKSSDSGAHITLAPKEYSKDSANVLVMNDTKPSLDEVVVVGYGATKRSKVSQVLKGKVSGIQTEGKIPSPRQGIENFNQYIKDSALVILDSTGQRVIANVLLSFRLNKKGYPRDIEVIDSSCKACESEAIRLLKNGPAWTGSSGAKGIVRIQF